MLDDVDDDWEAQRQWEEAKLAVRLFGAALADPTIMADLIAAGFADRDCTAPALAQLWQVAVPLYQQHGRVDAALLEESLTILMSDERARSVVAMCTSSRSITRREEIPTLLAHMRTRAGVRRMEKLGERVWKIAGRRGADLGNLILETRGAIDEIASTAAHLTSASPHELSKIATGLIDGTKRHLEFVPLGIPDIDNALGGGAVRGRMTLILAGTGAGKTTYGTHIALTAARAGKPTLYLLPDAEADREEMAAHFVEMLAGHRIPKDPSKAGREPLAELAAAAAQLAELPLWVEDMPGATVEDIENVINAHMRAHDLEEVVVDYAQDVEASTRLGRDDLNHKHVSKRLRRTAIKRYLAMVVLSQVSAPPSASGPPKKNAPRTLQAEDSAGSKQYAKDSAAVISVERRREDKDEKKRNVSHVRVLKNRFFGTAADAYMRWSRETTRLTPCTKDGDPVEQIEIEQTDPEPFP